MSAVLLDPLSSPLLGSPCDSSASRPPVSQGQASAKDLLGVSALQVLDDAQEFPAFSRAVPQADGQWESSVRIEGMHCAACAHSVEDALMALPGVLSAQVSGASHRALVVWDAARVRPSEWISAVQRRGYAVMPVTDGGAVALRRQDTRKALWRWLVAGLCMMQVMMYAYPAYIARAGDMTDEMAHLLRWASWLLTLPVMLFSAGPFFNQALRDIAARRISMDLPVALGILITFVVSTAGTFEPQGVFGKEVYFDSLTMFVFFLLSGRWLELRLRDRTAGALEALIHRLPDSVERQTRHGTFERVAARRLVAGDVMRVQPGESFAADGVVLLGDTLVDEALLTGESLAQQRGVNGLVVAGSHNLSSTVLVRVSRVGDETRFAQIVRLMQAASVSKPRVAVLADSLAKPFLLVVLLAAALACGFWWSSDPGHALMVAVAVLVVTCPCALSLATPAAMLAAAGAMARTGVLVRRLQAFEALARIDTVVFDKTGTLTRDAFVLARVSTRPGWHAGSALALAAALARHSRHPVSRALCDAAAGSGSVQDTTSAGQASTLWRVDAVRESVGQGVLAERVQAGAAGRHGAGDESLTGAGPVSLEHVYLGSAAFCGLPEAATPDLQVHLCDAEGWLATFSLAEDVRPEAAEVVTQLAALGITSRVLSGDGSDSVARVAAEAGIANAQAGCAPQDKLTALRALQAAGHHVAMVGDGMNDGPVLAGADVSFAFGRAVPLAQAQSDFVVLQDSLHAIVSSLRLARATMSVVKQNLFWAVMYNGACIPLAVLGLLPAWAAGLGMAASSLLVVLNALRLSVSGSVPTHTRAPLPQ